MKKNLFGLLAIVFAIGAVAFTTPKVNFADVFFQYNAPGGTDFTQAAVENPANYSEVANLTTGCSGSDVKACRIKVSDAFVTGTAPSRTLISTTDIDAAAHASGTYYVTIAADVLDKRNKP